MYLFGSIDEVTGSGATHVMEAARGTMSLEISDSDIFLYDAVLYDYCVEVLQLDVLNQYCASSLEVNSLQNAGFNALFPLFAILSLLLQEPTIPPSHLQ